jgi:predicted RNase H-like HicB family nuclease
VNITITDDDGGVGASPATTHEVTSGATPESLIENLKDLINELVENGAIRRYQGRALKLKLNRALRHLERDHPQLAIFNMRGLIAHVDFWESRGKLAANVAEDLRTQAEQIIDVIRAG